MAHVPKLTTPFFKLIYLENSYSSYKTPGKMSPPLQCLPGLL